jgi:hypothetical protein
MKANNSFVESSKKTPSQKRDDSMRKSFDSKQLGQSDYYKTKAEKDLKQ